MKLHYLLPAIAFVAAPAAFAATPTAHAVTTITAPCTDAITDGGLVSDAADPYSGHLIYRFTGRSTVAITGVTGIHDLMWDSAIGMTIDLPSTVTIAGNEYTVDTIDPAALANQDFIEHIIIPATITKIYPTAFANCPDLKSLEIFADTPPSIEQKTIHKGITVSVEKSAMKAYKKHPIWGTCNIVSGESTLEFDFAVPDIVDTPWHPYERHRDDEDNVTYTARNLEPWAEYSITGATTCSYDYCTARHATRFIVPATTIIDGRTYTVTAIGDCAFLGCTDLRSVTLPASIETIGDYAFCCSGIETIGLPASINAIGKEAFLGCTKLKSVAIDPAANIEAIADGTFKGCTALTTIDLSALRLNNIGSYAFADCTALTAVDLSALRLNDIGNGAFANCTALTAVSLPATLHTLRAGAFRGCTALTDCRNMNSMRNYSIVNTSVFSNCTALTTLTLPDGVEAIRDFAFDGCASLETINLPTSVKTLGNLTFYGCNSLRTINLPVATPPIKLAQALTSDKQPVKPSNAYMNGITIHVPQGTLKAYKKAVSAKGIKFVDDL